MNFRFKLQLAFLGLALAALGLTGWEATLGATEALRRATYDHLSSLRQARVAELERWFQDLGNHALALASDESTVAGLEAFTRHWAHLPRAPEGPLRHHYQSIDAPLDWFPADPRVLALQHHLIATNPYPVGRKDQLLQAPGAYGAAHATHHPTLHRYLSAFGFYDVLLIDAADARVVYTVSKEFDLGVRLTDPPFADSPLATVYRQAIALPKPELYVLQDFQPYIPSHRLPAAFLATPLWRAGTKIGVLAIQVSSAEINRLMSAERLGQTARLAIVGPDGTLRSGQDILKERIADFPKQFEETTVRETPNGRRLLRSHSKLRIPNVDWALMAEIDEAEAFLPVDNLQRRIWIIGAVIALVLFLAAAVLARSVTQPLLALTAGARRLGQRDFSFRLAVNSRDEIGQLAHSFNTMAESLERTTVSKAELELLASRLISAQEDERQRVARELHDDVTQRLAAIAIHCGTLTQSSEPTDLQSGVKSLQTQIAALARDIHGISHRLHPKMLDDLGLPACVEVEARALFERGGPIVETQITGNWTSLPKPIELALFRIVQEALRNVERHAQAESVSVRLENRSHEARLVISDDGRGFTARSSGLGLASMEERTRGLGGHFQLTSQPGQGTTITVTLPLP
ncbi:MAG: HAMP domain-containing protein [Acidobacteria bacterium]|nr:HAMP domain-containing protein [Acidobacteriota bacterium]